MYYFHCENEETIVAHPVISFHFEQGVLVCVCVCVTSPIHSACDAELSDLTTFCRRTHLVGNIFQLHKRMLCYSDAVEGMSLFFSVVNK